MTDCGCDPDRPSDASGSGRPTTANPPGQDRLRRRVAVHGASLARMRADLAAGGVGRPPALRTLARHPSDDPLIALLDTWAVVADVVAFYSERIAQEGYLRTATERASVRELARTLGHELRPGVAARAELAFEAETAAGAPAGVRVPRGTPVQSIPGQDELPQVFETSEDLEIRGAWNRLPVRAEQEQRLADATAEVWLRGTTTLRPGATVLVAPEPNPREGADQPVRTDGRDVRVVTEVATEPDGLTGWTRVRLDRPLGSHGSPRHAYVFDDTARVFGHNAPDPSLLVTERGAPPGSTTEPTEPTEPTDTGRPAKQRPTYTWQGIDEYGTTVDLDGDHPGVLAGGWIVLDGGGTAVALHVESATATGLSKWALAGPATAVEVDQTTVGLAGKVRPRTAKVHCASVRLPADVAPVTTPVAATSTTVVVVAGDPQVPDGRAVLVVGTDADTGAHHAERFTVQGTARSGAWTTITLDRPLGHRLHVRDLEVRANVVAASHGESVEQALGSGDGRTPFAQVRPRRGPLTYVRAPVPSGAPPGARAELEVRVDGVLWAEVASLADAAPTGRVYVVQHEEDAPPRLVFGDGVHGAIPPTGAENIRAAYRVGIGQAGAVREGQLGLLPRRPLGTRSVTNPGPAGDWAQPETLEDARRGAPLLIRSLGRVVSVEDHADFARTYAGIGQARADAVWDGRRTVVVLTVLAVGGADPSASLLADLRAEVVVARDPAAPVVVRPAEKLPFDVVVDVAHDPAHEPSAVDAAVDAALHAALGPAARDLAQGATAAQALLVVRSVPGVLACSMPRLLDDGHEAALLTARPARWDPDHEIPLRPAQLRPMGTVTFGVMTP